MQKPFPSPLPLLLVLAATGSPAPAQSRGVPALRAFYRQNCTACHGPDGTAVSPEGRRLKGLDFTNAGAMKALSDAEMARTILKGRFFGLSMPAFKKQLSEEEALLMAREVLRKAAKGQVIE